ncbi:MAG TPA: hypothetical protein VJU82_00675, partial [Acidobacteriaceae bacterium]|nr:hypothetical protein [Acidobacteriaceae bacterium]
MGFALVIALLPATIAAQARVRPIGRLRSSKTAATFSFDARGDGTVDLKATEASRVVQCSTDELLAATVWADKTSALLDTTANPAGARGILHFDGPANLGSCAVRIRREVSPYGSTITVLMTDSQDAQPLDAPLTNAEARMFVDRLRATIAAAFEMRRGIQGEAPSARPEDAPSNGRPYFSFQVEKQAALMPDQPGPQYPEELRLANIEGEVLAHSLWSTRRA